MKLVGLSEIVDILEVRKQRAHEMTGYKSFPKPVASLRQGRVWTEASVRKWRANHPHDPVASEKGRMAAKRAVDKRG